MSESGSSDSDRFEDAISALVAMLPSDSRDGRRTRLLTGMIRTCMQIGSDGTDAADLKLVEAALGEIRAALTCFRPYATARKVATFGSARSGPETPEYALARKFCSQIADAGYMVITGAGPGIMHACQEGAGRERSFGVNIRLPFENLPNPEIEGDAKLVEFKYFFTRKLFFVKEASAIVLFPGGFGTHDECFEALTLVQTGKTRMVPVVFLDAPRGTFWKTWDRYVRDHLLRRGLIDADDLSLYKITDVADEAVREITRYYRVFHSARVVRRRLVLRLNEEISASQAGTLSREFADILGGQPAVLRGPFEEEFDEPHAAHLPRLVLQFDMRSYGRLRKLIDRLNDLV
jgi:hypothetical protein